MIPAGSTSVTRSGPDGQLGYSWIVSFLANQQLANQGSLQLFSANSSALTGQGASIQVFKVRQGTFKEIQLITVATTAPLIDPLRRFSLSFGGQNTTLMYLRPSGNVCMSSIVEVQAITSSTIDTTAIGGQYQVSPSLVFRLVYGLEVTGYVAANPTASTDCSSSAAAIQTALEQLPAFFQVSVLGTSTGIAQGCVWTVIFLSSIGNVNQLQVETFNQATLAVGGLGYSSTAGDDTITTTTLIEGEKDAIKAALEQLSDVGTVTVTSVNVNQSISGECSWMVTFDTAAGSPLPLMTASIFNTSTSNLSSPYASFSVLGTESINITEVQAATSQVLGGEFALTFEGSRSLYLPYNATALQVQYALEELPTVGIVAVSRSSADENNGYTWAVTFMTDLGSLDLIVFDATSLTGTVASGTVTKLIPGVLPPFNSSDPILGLPIGSSIITNLSSLSVLMVGLDQGIPYYVRASAFNAIGQSAFAYGSDVFVVPEPMQPSPPQSPTLTSVDANTLEVAFSPPALDGGNAVNFYKV